MFNNLGEKLKTIAIITFILQLIAIISLTAMLSDVLIFNSFAYADYEGAVGLVFVVGGGAFAFTISSILYGVGDVIERMHSPKNADGEDDEASSFDILNEEPLNREHKFRKETEQVDDIFVDTEVTVVHKKAGEDVVMNCPKCKKKLYFDREVQEADCPYCDHRIKLK